MSKKQKTDVQDELISRAGELFATHSSDVFYFTADGTAFIQRQYAELHAANLSNNKIVTIKREEIK